MLKFFNRLTIVKRLIVSFSLILFLLVGITFFSQLVIHQAHTLYRYNLDYTLDRKSQILSFENYFYRLNHAVTHLKIYHEGDSPVQVDDQLFKSTILYHELHSFTSSAQQIQHLTDIYLSTLLQDDRLSPQELFYNATTISAIQVYVDQIYRQVQASLADDLAYLDIPAIDFNINAISKSLTQIRDQMDAEIYAAQFSIDRLLSLYSQIILFTVFSALVIGIIFAWLTIRSFTKQMHSIRDHVTRIKKGELTIIEDDADEIALVVNEIVHSMSLVVEEIGNIIYEYEKGNMDSRVDITKFQGIYRFATRGINRLIEVAAENHEASMRIAMAEQNSTAKSRFLARMSHEIRTPITAVLGISEIQLQNKNIPLDIEEAFANIHSSAAILLNIVNDILDMSKIEAGKMEITPKDYPLEEFISNTIQMNLVHLEEKPIDFQVRINPTLPSVLNGDMIRLKQVMINLLSNAFKYTDMGSVHLHLTHEPHTSLPDHINLVITVSDTGRGMSDEQTDALFEEYQRFQEKDAPYASGTGLGMPITKSILELMLGTLEVNSTLGEGTKVRVSIPQKVVNPTPLTIETIRLLENFQLGGSSNLFTPSHIDPISMPHGKVLVVDDVAANLYVAKGLISLYDIKVTTLSSGQLAIDHIQSGAAYDLIFMDQMMPEMDGTEATRQLRALGYQKPIIAFTANALVGQAEVYLEKGFDGFISKPIQTPHLHAILCKFIGDRRKNREPLIEGSDTQMDENDLAYLQDPELMKAIQTDFLETHGDIYEGIVADLSSNDKSGATIKSHTLKTLSALLLEKDLEALARIVEDTLKMGDMPNPLIIEKLGDEFNAVIQRIRVNV